MNEPDPQCGDISMLIAEARNGDDSARQKLFEHLHDELRGIAAGLMKRERPDHTLQATALVNEACLRMLAPSLIENALDRRYLFGAANRAMRQVLIDHARHRDAERSGGHWKKNSIDFILENFAQANGCDFSALNAALEELEKHSPRQREVIELRFFSGLSIPETAEVLQVSEGTVERDWRLARARLFRFLENG